ncbi:site-specific DNA-methyltransferase, partial [Escherichia coli]|nr:site-specific DNA-methyltransferase [Escherichia coli]EJF7728671.1 site-specific DNA-methyltransferase [Escherichia coli]EJF7820957.1 site-specific DNA-methyltransferase [Escherichia coli]EJF7838884.1 site-specific DNA-methyltransferase [Escherichia coli]EJF9013934.1 site-specific DNA-methyltransferase [Escherichia coli]
FMGSGATIKAAMGLGRRTIGVELESGRFEQTVGEILVLNDKLRNAQLDKNRS